MTRYVVTGCDGQLGGRVARDMLECLPGNELTFTCPDLDRLRPDRREGWERAGVSVREANYDDPEQMVRAFDGADRLFFVSSILNGPRRVRQHEQVIDSCVRAGVGHVVYTSFFGANRAGYKQYVLEDHRPTEARLRESGLSFNIMRNNLYMENYLTVSVILAMLSNDVWGTNAAEGAATYIAKDDSARCAAALMLGKGEPGADYDLTSLTPITQREICALIAERSGLPLRYVPMDDVQFEAYLSALHIPTTTDGDTSRAPVPFCTSDMVTNEGGIALGQMGVVSHDVETLLGRKPLEVEEIVDSYSYVWRERLTNLRQLR